MPTLRDLYPQFDEQALASTAETLDRYVDLVSRITERLVNDPEGSAEFGSLTQEREARNVNGTSTPTSDQ